MPYISIDQLTIGGDDLSKKDLRRIDEKLKVLIETTAGTLPGNRGYGVDPGIMDGRADETLNLLVMDLDEKTEKYIPEISIAGVGGTYNVDGSVKAKIYVERRE